MSAVNWDTHVNTKFYSLSGGYEDNREEVEYASGRKTYHLKNSEPKRTYSISLSLDDRRAVDGKTEFQWFLFWYSVTARSGTMPFYLTDLSSHEGDTLYRLADAPSWEGQGVKKISLSLAEV